MGVDKTSINTNTTTSATKKTTTKTNTEKKNKTESKSSAGWLKFGQSLAILGNTAMNIGSNFANLEMQKAMLKSTSIWGMSSLGMGGMGFFGGRDYSSWYMNGDPLGISWMGDSGAYNPYYTQMGTEMAYNWGAQLCQQAAMNQMRPIAQQQIQQQSQVINQQEVTENVLKDEDNEFAELDVSKQDTKTGKEFDEATDALADGSKKNFSLGVKKDKDGKAADNYRTKLSELGKSYLSHIEKNSSDGVDNDGIDIDEFKEHELAKLGKNVTAEKREEAEQAAENAFKKLDINGDNQIDWKEYSAAIMTFDQKPETKPKGATNDGQITSEDYKQWSTLMSGDKPNLFDVSLRRNYKELFNESDDE